MVIFLIGFMGSGKSTIGRGLAAKMDMKFIDLDTHIQEMQNQTIEQIFKSQGETFFRELECKYLREIAQNADNIVISTGGGTPCWGDNMEVIKRAGISIYLKCSPEMLSDRLLNSKHKRPLIEGKNETELKDYIKTTLHQRELFYNQASIIIANPSRDVTQIIEVLSYYKTNKI